MIPQEHKDFARLRAFIPLLVKTPGAISEMHIEDIARCALAGGYRLKPEEYCEAVGKEHLFGLDEELAMIVFDDEDN